MASKRVGVVTVPLAPDEPQAQFVWSSDTERVDLVAVGHIVASVTYLELLEAVTRLSWQRLNMLLHIQEEEEDGGSGE